MEGTEVRSRVIAVSLRATSKWLNHDESHVRHDLFYRAPTVGYIYTYNIYLPYIRKVWRMGLLRAWMTACWFLLGFSRSRICSAVRAESALCPLLSRFIRCTDDYRKPHLRSPTLIASPSSSLPPSAPFLSPRSFRVSLSSLRFELRSCISVSRVLLLLLLLLYSSHWTRILLANCSIRFDTFVLSYSVVTKISHESCGKIRVKNGVTYVIVIVIVKQSAIFQKIPLKTITFTFLYICAFS